MAAQKPASSNTQKTQDESMGRRKLFGAILIILLLVMGIVFAPPFARDEKVNDTKKDQPKVAAKDDNQDEPAGTGTVLGDTTQQNNSDEQYYPGYKPPTPTPAVQPAVATPIPQPTPTLQPEVVPPVEEPEACTPPEFTDEEIELLGEYKLDEEGKPYIEIDRFNNIFSYVAVTEDYCPVSWQPASEAIVWSEDGPFEKPESPLLMIIESERDPETLMHHGNTLRFRFKADTFEPVYEQQFVMAIFTEGSDMPVFHTIKVKVVINIEEPSECSEVSCLPDELTLRD